MTIIEQMAIRDALTRQAEGLIALLRNTGRRSSHRALRYRCARNCTLLEVYRFPDLGLVLQQPRYKHSPRLNAESSNESGRAANTVDGDRRWKGRTYLIEACLNVVLECDHLHAVVVGRERVIADAGAGREITITASDHDPAVIPAASE